MSLAGTLAGQKLIERRTIKISVAMTDESEKVRTYGTVQYSAQCSITYSITYYSKVQGTYVNVSSTVPYRQ